MTFPLFPFPSLPSASVSRDLVAEDILTVAPTREPLDIEEVKKQRRFSTVALDTRFDSWISAAREQFEEKTGLQLITATRVCLLERCPIQPRIYVRRAPLQSIVSVTYLDSSGDVQTMDADTYEMFPPVRQVGGFPNPGGVQLVGSATWPTTADRAGAVRVTYVAGYGNAPGAVPELINYALMQYVGDYHRFAENQTDASQVQALPIGSSMVERLALGAMIPIGRMTRW